MTYSVVVGEGGKLTLPREVREELGLHEGDEVKVDVEGGRAILRPTKEGENPFAEWIGAFPAFKTREEIEAWTKELRDEDEGESR